MKVLREFKYYVNGTKSEEKVSTIHSDKEVDIEFYYYDRKGQMIRYTYENSKNKNSKYEEKYEKLNEDGMPTLVKYKGLDQNGNKVEYNKLIEYDEYGSEKLITYMDKKGKEMRKIDMTHPD